MLKVGVWLAIIALLLFGGIEGCQWLDNHQEGMCYDNAKEVAKDPRVQVAMMDGYLTVAECRTVQDALEKKRRQDRIDEFMRAAKS